MKIKLTATNQIKDVYSVVERNGKYKVKFTPSGKAYTYRMENIEIIGSSKSSQPESDNEKQKNELIVYHYSAPCYKCHNILDILTYITFEDTYENLTYPWNKHRLNYSKSWNGELAHMQDESIEYYPISVIGNIATLDRLLLKRFAGKVQAKYSQTVNRVYPMNICPNCGAQKGNYFVYREVNQIIFQMQKLEIAERIDIANL